MGPGVRRDDDNLLLTSASPLLHQRIARGGELQKFPRAAAAVRMRALGDALVGPVDFDTGQTAAERQSQQLPITFLRAQ